RVGLAVRNHRAGRCSSDFDSLPAIARGAAAAGRCRESADRLAGASGLQQGDELVEVEIVGGLKSADQVRRELALALVEGEDAFFDRAFGDEAIDGDRARLADAVGAIGGLI